jgi:hypothetical protein
MARLVALLLLLLAPTPDSPWIPFHEALKKGEVVLTAEVVDISTDAQGTKTVELRPEKLLKGKYAEKLIRLYFRPIDPRIGCPPERIDYVKGGKYLLLLAGNPPGVIYPQLGLVDDRTLQLTSIVLDLLEGRNVEERVRELGPLIDAPIHSRWAYEAMELLTRRQARPILPAARRYFQANTWHWPKPLPELQRESYLGVILINSRWTMDFSQLPQTRKELAELAPWRGHFLYDASRVCGRPFGTLAEFDAWWERTLRRSKTVNSQGPAHAEEILRQIRSGDPAAREGAVERLLDLGLTILPTIEGVKKDSNEHVRAVALAVEDGLLLLKDFKEDLDR